MKNTNSLKLVNYNKSIKLKNPINIDLSYDIKKSKNFTKI